ncbi:MAG: FAD/NAD(P)-binding protein [Trichloromonadaceae bacterium]
MSLDFLPLAATLSQILPGVPDNQLFRFRPQRPLALAPGQFVELSLPGVGAFAVSAANWPTQELVESCIRKAGRVTSALYGLTAGAQIGLRGPFGNGFPLSLLIGQDVLLLAGGLGMAPLRGLLHWLLAHREEVGDILLLYGSRDPASLLFRQELEDLAVSGSIQTRFSVDFAPELPWSSGPVLCRVGLVSELLDDLNIDPKRTVAAVCGPPGLYRCVLEELACLGIAPQRIFATLERRMQCGVGQCCHCVTAGTYICQQGPVFSLAELRQMEGAV